MRTWTWGKRAAMVGVDLQILGKFIIISIGIIANVLFLVNVGSALNWLVVWKKQSFAPTVNQEYAMQVYLIIAFPLKTVQIVHDLLVICWTDVFFIDWERPKSRQMEWPHLVRMRAVQSKASIQEQNESPEHKEEARTSRTRRGSVGKSSPGSKPSISGVSIWRSLFVANEWLELFSHRRICLELHLFFVILLMKVWNLEEYTKYIHSSSEEQAEPDHESMICRVALGFLVYVSLILVQILYFVVIHERFVKDKRKDFVDFCSVSNISVFIWVHKRYGFYIHGRSPNGRAEVNMKEMNDLLQREEEDLCSKRGLLPNTDQQTFEMTLPFSMYDQYQRLRSILAVPTTRSTRIQNLLNSRTEDIEKKASAYIIVTKFLSSFIDHTLNDFDYIVKDKTTLEYILDAEFDERRDQGYFYNDNGLSFERVLMSGSETSLIIFELMLFIFIDVICWDYILAAIITFITSRVSSWNIYWNFNFFIEFDRSLQTLQSQ